MFGLPASGKTFYIHENHLVDNYMLVSADKIKEKMPEYSPSEAHKVHQRSVKVAEKMMYDLADNGVNMVMDGGGINNNYTIRIFNYLKEKGYEVTLIHIDTPLEKCLERNEERLERGEMYVPKEAIIEKSEQLDFCLNRLKGLVDVYKQVKSKKNKTL
jgi:predicted kinase